MYNNQPPYNPPGYGNNQGYNSQGYGYNNNFGPSYGQGYPNQGGFNNSTILII
jgi:hypothetical protein